MTSQDREIQIGAATTLVEALQSNDEEQIEKQIAILMQSQGNGLFQQVGKLTRDLHESLNNFQLDSQLTSLTEKDIPDTRDRLNFVIKTTEEATHKTLGYIDNTLLLAQELKESAEKIDESWRRFRKKEMNADEFRKLVKEIEAYLPAVTRHADKVHDNLSEMMLAQGFQDLTGQVISQVITLVEKVEDKLIRLVKVEGKHIKSATEHKDEDTIKAEGPQINKDKPNVVKGQEDVDDLLSSLGF